MIRQKIYSSILIGKKKENHIKKPLNAFMLYMKEMRPVVQAECTLKESAAINQILGRRVSSNLIISLLYGSNWLGWFIIIIWGKYLLVSTYLSIEIIETIYFIFYFERDMADLIMIKNSPSFKKIHRDRNIFQLCFTVFL